MGGRARLDLVHAAAAMVPAGDTLLVGPELFVQDARQRTVVHALLSDASVPRALAEALHAPLRTPHLSIARVRKNGDVDAVVAAIGHLLPLSVRLETLELTQQTPEGWITLARAPLSGPRAARGRNGPSS